MPRHLSHLILLMLLTSPPTVAQVYRCTGSDGKVTLQQSRCAPSEGATPQIAASPAAKQTADKAMINLIMRCSSTPKHSAEYATCSAELACREAGGVDAAIPSCVQKLTDARRRADRRAEELAAATAREASQQHVSTSANSGVVDCTDLSLFAASKGHNFIERAMIVNDARERGKCR